MTGWCNFVTYGYRCLDQYTLLSNWHACVLKYIYVYKQSGSSSQERWHKRLNTNPWSWSAWWHSQSKLRHGTQHLLPNNAHSYNQFITVTGKKIFRFWTWWDCISPYGDRTDSSGDHTDSIYVHTDSSGDHTDSIYVRTDSSGVRSSVPW